MMGPEAALVSARIAELRALGKSARGAPKRVPMYVEAAARARLDPFGGVERARERGVWAWLRAAVRRPIARPAEPEPGWTVAAAPIVAKDALAGTDGAGQGAGLLAGLPVLSLAEHP